MTDKKTHKKFNLSINKAKVKPILVKSKFVLIAS